MKTFFAWLTLVVSLSGAQVYQENGGLVMMEVENTKSPLGLWEKKNSLTGYSGSGYLEFTGNSYSLGKANSPLSFHFKIHEGGTYLIDLHCAKALVEGHSDWANDCYVRVVGDFTPEPGPHDLPQANASLNLLKTDTKYFGGAVDQWQWAAGDWAFTGGRLDPGGKNNKRKALYNFRAGETYTLVVSGRSKAFRLDRIVFRKTSLAAAVSHEVGEGESKASKGTPPVPDSLDVTVKAADCDRQFQPDDPQNRETHLAVMTDGSWICFKEFDFGVGAGGSIDLHAASAGAGGLIEVRSDSATGPLLGTVAVKKTWKMADYEELSANLVSVSGKKDLYFVFKGKGEGRELFHFKDFVIRSGVSVEEKLATPPIRPPAGRLAYIADGNSPDPDDLGGTAAALAMLRAAGLADRLVYGSHSCDLVKAGHISEEAELERQKLMQVVCDGTASRWGGFAEITFWNCRTQQAQAIHQLRDQINVSSESDPLWILEAGEPDIIGYALAAAEPEKRQHVKLVTHHPVNDRSGDFFKWKQMLDFGVEEVRIPDQNGTSTANGLQRSEWAFHWARDHEDSRIKWIWEQAKIAEKDPVVGFQKGKMDLSDSGLMIYWITGGNVNGGYRTANFNDVRKLLERGL